MHDLDDLCEVIELAIAVVFKLCWICKRHFFFQKIKRNCFRKDTLWQYCDLYWKRDTYLCWTGTVDIFVISQPKWLKFGLLAHFPRVFGHTKFQLSISCTFKVMKLLVEITKYTTKTFTTLKVQYIESWNYLCPIILKKMCLETKFQPFW